jgi:hypothetical protein
MTTETNEVTTCAHCGFTDEMKHQDEHPGLCCGCLDLSCGMPLEQLNVERAGKGWPPITKPWPVRSRTP